MTSRRGNRVLICSEYFAPHWTGLAYGMYLCAKDLVAHGKEVTILTTKFRADLPSDEELDGISIRRAPYAVQLSRSQYSPQTIILFSQLISSFDYVLVNSPHSNVLPIALLTRLHGKSLSLFHQGDLILPNQTGSRILNRLVERAFDVCTGIAVRLASRISSYTEDYSAHSRVLKRHQAKFRPYIPPIPRPALKGTPPIAEKLRALRSSSELLIGCAGRFVEEKGLDVLLRAAIPIRARYPSAKIVFAGATDIFYEPFFQSCEHLIGDLGDGFHALGLLRGPDLCAFYRTLDLFVLPSRTDCFALTQVEAALCGIPLVVSDIPGARVLARETGCGQLVPAEDSTALAEAISHVFLNRSSYADATRQVPEFLHKYADPERCL